MDVSKTLWAATAPPGPPTEPLRGEARADVAIVGAGYTGLSTALHLAETGVSVAVLEANTIGSGASGRNNGQVIPTLTRHDPDAILAALGQPWGERLVRLLVGSADLTFQLISKHAIPCDAVQNGWVQPAHTPGRVALARRRVAQWSRHGAPAAFLDREELTRALGIAGYLGGWINRSGGHINPLALARGLARVAIAAGAAIHERSAALALEPDGAGWRLRTAAGVLRARKVLLATAAYADDLAPDLRRSIVPVRAYQVATRPLGDNLRRHILPGNQAMSDMRMDLRFCHYDRDGRLITGGSLALPIMTEARLKDVATRRLSETFPELDARDFEFYWHGQIAMTMDRLPRLFRLDDGVYSWIGCNGRGVALGTALGPVLAGLLSGQPEADMPLPVTGPRPIFAQALLARLGRGALPYYRWRDRREIAL